MNTVLLFMLLALLLLLLYINYKLFKKVQKEGNIKNQLEKFLLNNEENIVELIKNKDNEILMLQQIPVAVYVKENIQFVYEELDDFKGIVDLLKESEQFYGDSSLTEVTRRSIELLDVLKDFKKEIDKLVMGESESE